MFRSIPISNRIISENIDLRNQTLHLRKLEEIRKSISKTKEIQFANNDKLHSALKLRKNNKKKETLKEFYYTEVERENRILLEKMSKILRKSSEPKGFLECDFF